MEKRILNKLKQIELKKEYAGSRKDKKLKKISKKLTEIFIFFLKSYRADILTFCGYDVKVNFNINSFNAKIAFREFENGVLNIHNLKSKHPNILKALIVAKKSWGLFLQEWTDGIVECNFTKEEILSQFINIKIPDSFLKEFDNLIIKKKKIRNLKELKRLNNE